jgi:23S rRNA (uridine2552-2'-O)-methyltransferase
MICSNDKNPCVLALDLLDIDCIGGVVTIKGDFLDEKVQEDIIKHFTSKADVIVSDMAPNTTGERTTDHIRIMSLCEQAFGFAKNNLNEGGSFIAKIFRGGTEHNLLKEIKSHFKIVKHFKPDASRQESSEMYLIATGFKNKPSGDKPKI